ncbi:lipopolysaccharide biosynthesis protein [Lentimicrobium sp. S6]|uniref:lipopolysaccharide biosynthesis protein n=1 Tax=Lentimicrobium sp. S6 TaxID=2735872 RepID=UPI001554549A|nr:oligosaccharide flippase family protein [Lentimicrobium sp. S6]NPD46733.1 oligosaccharide flippase family protein [Lentimicrobium sp. S6]
MSKFIKNISLYSFGSILNKSIQFLLLPLYTHFLTPTDYGILELTYLYGALLVIFYGFIIENGYVRLYFDKKESLYRDTLFGTAFIFKIVVGLGFLSISFLFSDAISIAIIDVENGALFIQLISLSVFIKAIAEIPLKTLIVEKRALRYLINNSLFVLVSLSSTVYFVVFMELGIEGVLYGQIVGSTTQFIILVLTELKWRYFRFSISYLSEMLYFSIFLIPTSLASFITYWSNRYFLQEHSSLEDVGIFSLGYKIASIIPILITGPIKKVVGPEIYGLIDNPEECKNKIRHFTSIILFFLLFFGLSLSMFSKELVFFMASTEFASSYEVVFILSMGYVMIGIAGIVVLPINITKKTWLITITWILGSLLNVLLNYYLIDVYGKEGAAYATFLTFLFILTLYFVFSERVYRVGFEYKKYISLVLFTGIIYYISSLIKLESIVLNILIKFFLLVTSILIIVKVFLNLKEKAFLITKVNSLFSIKKMFKTK